MINDFNFFQGSLIAFVAFSQRKLLNITRSAALLSPIAHMRHITSVATKLAAELLLADVCETQTIFS